jgi:hypothetical protein
VFEINDHELESHLSDDFGGDGRAHAEKAANQNRFSLT